VIRKALPIAMLVAACGRAPLPARLGGLARTKVWQGERAARLVEELHGKAVAPVSSAVAEYGRAGELRLYLSSFPDGAEANRTLAAMLVRLESGETPFMPPRELRDQPGRWFTVGPGGHHALWAAGSSVYWLTGDPLHLQRAAAELPSPPTGAWT
jgi:hypothetical protein